VRYENRHHVSTPSLKPSDPHAEQLAVKLGQEVIKVADCIGDGVERAVKALQPGQILVLENVQFYKVGCCVNWRAKKTLREFSSF
jgi:3-phosphoglycerate kinase